MGVISDGNSYGVHEDLLYSFPVVIKVTRLHLNVKVVFIQKFLYCLDHGYWGASFQDASAYWERHTSFASLQLSDNLSTEKQSEVGGWGGNKHKQLQLIL